MLKLVKNINEQTNQFEQVFEGTDISWALSQGFEEQQVEKAFDDNYYLLGYAPTKPLAELKTEKWQQIKQARDNAEQAGVTYLGKVLDSDSLSVQRITVAVQTAQLALSAGQEFTIDWTCQDNSTLTLNAQQVIGIPMALAAQSNNLHQKARELRELIDIAATKEELELIAWE